MFGRCGVSGQLGPGFECLELFRAHADGGAGRAGAHAGPSAAHIVALIAFDGFLFGSLGVVRTVRAGCAADAEQQPQQHVAAARFERRHLDHIVRAVGLAVAAADAVIVDEDLTVGCAVDGVGRAVFHAVRVLTVAAGGGHMHGGERRAGFAIESRESVMSLGAGLFTKIATNTQSFVDHQDVCGFAQPLIDQVGDHMAFDRLVGHAHELRQTVVELRFQGRRQFRVDDQ